VEGNVGKPSSVRQPTQTEKYHKMRGRKTENESGPVVSVISK